MPSSAAAGPGASRIVLVAGKPVNVAPGQHEYVGGMQVLRRLLSQTSGVSATVVDLARAPLAPRELIGARSIVFIGGGGPDHPWAEPRVLAAVERALAAGSGLVLLHDALDVPEAEADRALRWIGGRFKRGVSKARLPGWPASFGWLPDHPATRGVSLFDLEDQWFLDLVFVEKMAGVTPVLRTIPPEHAVHTPTLEPQIEAWAFERPDGGRSFAVAAPHQHDSWRHEDFRRLVTNGILWTAGVAVPEKGAPVRLTDLELKRWVMNKPPAVNPRAH